MSHLYRLQKTYAQQGLSVIAFNSKESPEEVAQFCLENGPINYKIFVQAKTVGQYPGGGSVPRCYVIGPEGKILWKGHPDKLSKSRIKKFLNLRSATLNKMFQDAPKKARNYLISNKKALAYKAAIAAAKKEKNPKKKKAAKEMAEYLQEQYDEQLDYASTLYDNREYGRSKTILDNLRKRLKGTEYVEKIKTQLNQFQDGNIKKQAKELQKIEAYLRNYINPKNGKKPKKKQLLMAVMQLRALARQKRGSPAGEKAGYYADLLEPIDED